MKQTKQLSYEELLGILKEHDTEDEIAGLGDVPVGIELGTALTQAINPESLSKQAVLGFDVYRYSQMKPLPQSLVPFVVRLLYSEACRRLRADCPYLFRDTDDKEFRTDFIDTGDGGFQILSTPIHSVAFAVGFESLLRAFNSYAFFPCLRKQFNADLIVRYAITYDGVFSFEGNHYGPGIINNGRIIAKDRLNRCLIDQGTFDWFTRNIRGVENLSCIGLQDLQRLPDFKENDESLAGQDNQMFPPRGGFQLISAWKDIDILKIGDISVKDDRVSIYSLHLHLQFGYGDDKDDSKSVPYTVTLGNLNTSGISDP